MAAHILFIFYGLTWVIGILSFMVILLLYKKFRSKEIKAYIFYYSSMSTLIMLLGVNFYLMPYPNLLEYAAPIIEHVRYFATVSILFSSTYFLFVFLEKTHNRLYWKLTLSLTAIELLQFLLISSENRLSSVGFITYELLMCGYCFYLAFSTNRKKIPTLKLEIIRTVLYTSIAFIPGFLYDIFYFQLKQIFPALIEGFVFAVFLYFVWNLIFICRAYPYLSPSNSNLDELALMMESLPITNREKEIIPLIIEGKSNSKIASQLFIAESTVKRHIHNLFQKCNVSNRTQLLHHVMTHHKKG